MILIDSHAHLYMSGLNSRFEDVVGEFVKKGGKYILNCGVNSETNQQVLEQSQKSEVVLPAVGIHPEILVPGTPDYANGASYDWIDSQVELLDQVISKFDEIAALGEIGLDYYWVKNNKALDFEKIYTLQKYLLAKEIELACEKELPVVLHCRDIDGDKHAESDMLNLIVKKGNSCVRGLMHSYTGSKSYLKEFLNLGFYVSFNGIVTYPNADNVRDLLELVPMDRILLETDAPFLVPLKYRNAGIKVCESSFMDEPAEVVAKIKGVRVETLWGQVEENFKRLFKVE